MKKVNRIIIMISFAILSVTSIILSIISIVVSNRDSKEILGYAQLGLKEFVDEEIVSIYFDGLSPAVIGEYDNFEVVKEIKEIVKNGVYQKTQKKKTEKKLDGIGTGYTIIFTSINKTQYVFSPQGGTQTLLIRIDNNDAQYYNSNITTEIDEILNKIYNDMENNPAHNK